MYVEEEGEYDETTTDPIKGVHDEEGDAVRQALYEALTKFIPKENITFIDCSEDTGGGQNVTAFEYMIDKSLNAWYNDNLGEAKDALQEALRLLIEEMNEGNR